ncbi:hypothetical protein KY290_024914 [Solanum tuberosum]|uniref:FBD domain-containing protein n=1 Tax=Solanum tuberosum TaxID=4113 RepID=A0ABQ7UTV6_SOLTU|nr:hypothetical protein KY284_023769 [Solanum tuberosum]KAH0754644.1 hypothetical protein KY290_024914 [Solanum tuberosum]
MLRSFDFIGSIHYICFKNIPLLAKVSLIDNESSEKSRKCDITNFFKSFVVLGNLKLNEASLKLFAAAAGGVPTRLPFDLKIFKYLRIYSVTLDQQGFSDVMFSHLKKVKLQGFLATKAGMQFIKLLLDKSHVLAFRRASPNAEVAFHIEYDSDYDDL